MIRLLLPLILLLIPYSAWAEPILSEVLASNLKTKADEDGTYADWIEIHNPTDEQIPLSGWALTDDPGNLQQWRFPSQAVIAPNAYMLIYASGKDRGSLFTTTYHTNFSLSAGGEYLALVNAAGEVVDEFAETYPEQYRDISYGVFGGEYGYMAEPTPGAANKAIANAPPTPVVFPQGTKTFTDAIVVELTHEDPDVEIRYTTNGSEPTNSLFNQSAVYTGPITLDKTTRLRARALKEGSVSGLLHSESYLEVDAEVAAFTSNLPICFLDSFGVNVDNLTTGVPNEELPDTSSVFIDVDPETSEASALGDVDSGGHGGMRIRGESSAGFAKKQYAYETRDEDDDDRDVSILGLPTESDWVIHAPYSDKTLMRNYLVYGWFDKMGHYSVKRKFMEVFFNWDTNQPITMADYRGVYILVEKIKRDSNRVALEALEPQHAAEPEISGGYILRKDKSPEGHVIIRTPRENQDLQLMEPDGTSTAAQRNWITAWMGRFENALHGPNMADPEEGYAAYIDVENFIDNHILVEIAKNIDGYRLSNYVAKPRGGKLFAIPWDYNLSLGNADYLNGYIPQGWYYDLVSTIDYPWYRELFTDPEFALQYADRWYELRKELFKTEALMAEIDETTDYLREAADRNFVKWPTLGTYLWPNAPGATNRRTYQSEIDFMKEWLQDRVNWMDDEFEAPVIFSTEGDMEAGNVTLTIKKDLGLFNPRPGTIYYTTDGSDPRLRGGEVNPAAQEYINPILLENPVIIRARLLRTTGAWTAIDEINFIEEEPASSANFRITEVMYHPSDPSEEELAAGFGDKNAFEYLEFLNSGDKVIQLTGVVFDSGIEFDFSNGEIPSIEPGARVLVVANRVAFELRYGSGLPVVGTFASGQLANSGERLAIRSADGETITDFEFSDSGEWPVESDGGGYSIVLKNDWGSFDWNDGSNWIRSAELLGSPGEAEPEIGGSEGYDDWKGSFYTEAELADAEVSGDAADADGDGLATLLEYALGTHPKAADSENVFNTSWAEEEEGRYFVLSFPKNAEATDVTAEVEISTDLTTWDSGSDQVVLIEEIPGSNGTNEARYRSALPIADQHQAYMRVRVTSP